MTDQVRVPIGEAIRRARLENGWSQGELSWRAHIAQTEISKYENGRMEPSLRSYLKLCDVFGWETGLPSSAASGDDLPWYDQSPPDLRERPRELAVL